MNQLQSISDQAKNFLGSVVEDSTGGASSIRVLMLTWGIGVFVVWAFAAVWQILHTQPLPDIPSGVIVLTLGITGAKTAQRALEK